LNSELVNTAEMRTAGEILIKLVFALVLAAMIGWERERRHRPAGIRTHMLMMLGVVLFAEASKAFSPSSPDRIAAQILTGVGFLGAGTIMRYGAEVRGLTSAASIWATAAIGVIVSLGGGFYLVALFATLLALFVLAIVNRLEMGLKNGGRTRLLRVNVQNHDVLTNILEGFSSAHVATESLKILDSEAGLQLELLLTGDPVRIMEVVAHVPGVNSVSWSV